MMNKTNFILLIISLAISFPLMASCGESKDDPTPSNQNVTVTTTPDALTSGPASAVLELSVRANADWAIRTDADWVTLRPSGGVKDTDIKVQVTVKENSDMDERTATLNIVSGGKTIKTVSLTQGYVTKATSSVKSITMGGQASSSALTVTANADWSLTTDAAWLTITPAKGGKGDTAVEVKANANDQTDAREAIIYLTCGDDKTEIRVSQLSDAVETPKGYFSGLRYRLCRHQNQAVL